MGCCISNQEGDSNNEVTPQQNIEEAIDRHTKMKETLENNIEELQQKLQGSRYGRVTVTVKGHIYYT